MVAGPTPRTRSRSEQDVKGPLAVLSATMASAFDGPIPGSAWSPDAFAALMLTAFAFTGVDEGSPVGVAVELGGVLPRRSRGISDRTLSDHEGQVGTDRPRIGAPTHEASSLSVKWDFTLWELRKQKPQIIRDTLSDRILS
mgnify:CR=1 FL=1